MKYVYHKKSPNMEGSVLFPLNLMKNNQPEIYDKQIAAICAGTEVLIFANLVNGLRMTGPFYARVNLGNAKAFKMKSIFCYHINN